MNNTYEILNKAVEESCKEVVTFELLSKKVVEMKKELKSLKSEKSILLEKLKKENKDVEKIIGISFASVFATILNNREEKLEKEEREALEARVNFDRISSDVEYCEDEIESLNTRILELVDAKSKYKKAMEAKKEQILKSNPNLWESVKIKELDIEKITGEIKEINEALYAGRNVINDINIVQRELNSAKSWGTYDMLGGGMIATMVKRDHMNKAQDTINKLNRSVKIFSKELKDVNGQGIATLDIANYLSIMDYFFDGFFVDWAVQSKINDAINKVGSLDREIGGLTNKLRNDLIELEKDKISINC